MFGHRTLSRPDASISWACKNLQVEKEALLADLDSKENKNFVSCVVSLWLRNRLKSGTKKQRRGAQLQYPMIAGRRLRLRTADE
jgi:hypothetical protein